jgi:hypothetical protein
MIAASTFGVVALVLLVFAARIPLARAQTGTCTTSPTGTSCGYSPCTTTAISTSCGGIVAGPAAAAVMTPATTADPPETPTVPPPPPLPPTQSPTATPTATATPTVCNLLPTESTQNSLSATAQAAGGLPCPTPVCYSNNLLMPGALEPGSSLCAPGNDQICNNGQGPTIPIGLSCPDPTSVPMPTPIPTPVVYPQTVTVTSGDDIPRIPGRENQPPVGVITTRIGNQVTISIANNTLDPLNLQQTVDIQTAPDVIATSASATAGTATVQSNGSEVVWSNLSLDSGAEATITLNLAAAGGAPLPSGGGPVIQSVTVDGSDASTGEAVVEGSSVGVTPQARASGTYSCQGPASGANCQSQVPGETIAGVPSWLSQALELAKRAVDSLRGPPW